MLPLADHPIEESIKKRREKLAAQWDDDQVFDCTPKTAQLVLLYVDLENRLQEKVPAAGRSFFFWDPLDAALLHLYIVDDEGLAKHAIEITHDGTLRFFDTTFNAPQDLLKAITLKRYVVHYRVIIPANSPLASVLCCRFDSNCELYCPPEYPPLLVHIAIANNDLATAAAIFDHPFIHASDRKSPEDSRLHHLLKTTLSNAVTEDKKSFLEYLIQKYDLMDCKEYLFKPAIAQAVECKNQEALEYLFEKTAFKNLSMAFEAAFSAVVKVGEKSQFFWLLDKTLPEAPVKEFSKASFLKTLLIRLGPDCFKLFVSKVAVDVPKQDLVDEFIFLPMDPMSYLPCYMALPAFSENEDALEVLPLEMKAKMLLQFINYREGSEISWNDFLGLFFPKSEQTSILSSALLLGLKDEKNAAILIDAGVIPTAEHFDQLLRAYGPGSQRLEIFKLFLDSVPDFTHGKKSLTIAAAFGQEAVKMVFDRFPELATQMDFILALTTGVWKGAEVATDQVLFEVMSMQGKKEDTQDPNSLVKESVNFSLDENLLALPLAHGISLNYLLDILLPRKQVDKIALALKQKPECCYGFWHGCIFSGFEFFENPDWEKLAAESLCFLEEPAFQTLIEQAFYYSHLQLAEVWLKVYLSMQFNRTAAFKWFEAALNVSNAEAVPLFVKYDLHLLLDEKNETFLYMAVANNAISFVSVLLKLDPNVSATPQISALSYAHAVQNQYLTICRLLRGDACFEEIAQEYTALPADEIEERLYQAVLNSSCKDVERLCTHLLALPAGDSSKTEQLSVICKKIEQFIQNCGSLIVRFPSPQAQNEMHICYGRAYARYSLQQRTWGEECGKYYEQLVYEYQHTAHTLFELLMKFTKLQASLKAYNFWRMGSNHSLMTYFHGRYFSFWRIAQKMFKRLLKDPLKYTSELCCTLEGYQVLYQLDGSTQILLSNLHIRSPFVQGAFKGWMGHSEPGVTKSLLPHLEKLFNEIQNFSIPPDEKGFPEELKRKIALLFWLGCHLVFTTRGSSQYMLLLHRLLFDLHGFQTPPWDLNFVQPDCVAIMLPFSVFYEEYYDALFDV